MGRHRPKGSVDDYVTYLATARLRSPEPVGALWRVFALAFLKVLQDRDPAAARAAGSVADKYAGQAESFAEEPDALARIPRFAEAELQGLHSRLRRGKHKPDPTVSDEGLVRRTVSFWCG